MGSPVSHSKYRTSQLANLRIKNLVGSMRKRTPCIVVLPAKSIISMCHGRLRWRLCAMTSLDLRQTLQPHLTFDLLSPVHTNNNVEATLDFVEATFDFAAQNGNNVERVYRKMSSFRQNRMLLRHCCRYWQQCRTKCRNKSNMFDLVRLCRNDEMSFDMVAKTGN